MKERKNWTPQQKLQVVMAILKGDETIERICQKFSVAPTQAYAWKKHFLENGYLVFEGNKAPEKRKDSQKEVEHLYQKIGRLTVERDFLKKNYEAFQWMDEEK